MISGELDVEVDVVVVELCYAIEVDFVCVDCKKSVFEVDVHYVEIDFGRNICTKSNAIE